MRGHPFRDKFFNVIFSILKTEGLLRQFKKLLKDLLSAFRFRDVIADFTLGLGNPADTGLLFAVIGPATALFGESRFHKLIFRPSFSDDTVLEGYSHGTVRLRPIRLIPPVVKFAFSAATIRMAGTFISSKWKRKN